MDHQNRVKVTISDPENGNILEEKIVHNDYCLITSGNRYVKSIRIMGRTHIISVAITSSDLPAFSEDA